LEDIKDKVHRHLPFGEGDIDFPGVRTALAEIGYSGPLVIDLFGPNMEPIEAAQVALAGLTGRF
jgi:sugar phosphate isomerase/epimerase